MKQVTESEKKLRQKSILKNIQTADEKDAEPEACSADVDDPLIYHDYTEQSSNRPIKNEIEIVDHSLEEDSDSNSRDDVADIHKIAEECENGTIEIETIDEQKRNKKKVVSTKTTQSSVSYDCPMCDKQFRQQNFFHVHVGAHDVSTIKCTKCDAEPEFDLPGYFKHYKDYHKYQCKLCDKSLVTKSGYDYHMSLHTSTVRYKCTVKHCRRSYVTMEQLKCHIPTHNITKIYPCNLCDATFKHKDNLNYHLKQHAGKKDHLCSMCGRAFFQSGALQIHMLRHTNTKRFCCELCGKGFLTGSSMRKHSNMCRKKRAKAEEKERASQLNREIVVESEVSEEMEEN